MILFEFFLIASALLAVGVALRRTRAAEADADALRARIARRDEAHEETEALAAAGLVAATLCEAIVGPLTGVLAQCEIGRGAGEPSPRLGAIEGEARRIAAAFERYRGLLPARQIASRIVDPLRLADEVVESQDALARERDVSIHRLYDDVPAIEGPPLLWHRALQHLLRAGIRAAPRGIGDVTLAVGELDGAVVFCVADDGPGMDALQIRSAVAPFECAAPALRSTGESYAVVAMIAEAAGAAFVIESEPGGGTRASLKVPVGKTGPARGGPGDGAPDGNRTHVSSLGSWRSTIELQARR
jgi:signal transduction histidine kinase